MELKLYHFMPDKLNLYGDIGNVIALKKRCEWRGIDLKIENITSTDGIKLSNCDIFFIGGGSDREQCIATEQFSKIKNEFKSAIEDGIPALTICGGYQFLGEYYKTVDGDKLPGLNILDFYTESIKDAPRLIGNILVESERFGNIVGFENHGGRTYLHGPILPKNPNVADYLIKAALDNKYGNYDFIELNNEIELNANSHMVDLLRKNIK